MNMKHKLLIVSVLSGFLFLLGGCGYNKNNSLVVFNYGDYLDPSIIDSFEKETGIKILYEEYQSPEEMYMKYKADIVDYDVICSSDYILEKLPQIVSTLRQMSPLWEQIQKGEVSFEL